METLGMTASIYRDRDSDPQNGHSQVLIIGDKVPGIIQAGDLPVFKVITRSGRCDGVDYSFPAAYPINADPDVGRWAFGGTFVYSCDSRFPSEQPIKIFDYDTRYECQ